jgi:hypothetical protein
VEDKRLPFDPRATQNKISSIIKTLWDHSGIALGLLRDIFGVAVEGMISSWILFFSIKLGLISLNLA